MDYIKSRFPLIILSSNVFEWKKCIQRNWIPVTIKTTTKFNRKFLSANYMLLTSHLHPARFEPNIIPSFPIIGQNAQKKLDGGLRIHEMGKHNLWEKLGNRHQACRRTFYIYTILCNSENWKNINGSIYKTFLRALNFLFVLHQW